MSQRFIVDGTELDWDGRLMFKETLLLKRQLGLNVQQWEADLQAADVEALGVLIWLLFRRTGDTRDFDEFDFDFAGLDVVDVPAAPAKKTAPRRR